MTRSFGWVPEPEEVLRTLGLLAAEGNDPFFVSAASHLIETDDNAPVFFWEAEQKILGKVLPSWDQGGVGSCVSFGFGRAAQDLLLLEIAQLEEPEQWPGAEVATEPIYGGSRVEVGQGRISGDGSVGAWAAKWVKDWGLLLRQVYGTYDLTRYSESLCRDWGRRGVPDDLEPTAREHPIKEVALVRTGDELWAALGAWKPVPPCSNRGFTTTLQEGFCEPRGQWNHCMEYRGRFISPKRGKSVVVQNSWGGYLSGNNKVEVEGRGIVELPQGCFCTTLTVAHDMVRQGDSFALSRLEGWKRERLDWTP